MHLQDLAFRFLDFDSGGEMQRLLDKMLGRPDPIITMPKVKPVATREEDGTITFTAIVPKLDPKSVQIDREGKGHFVVPGGQLGTAALVAVACPRRCFRPRAA
jgi:hypothetical protein